QVPVEALLAGRAKGTVKRTAGLRGKTQRAAVAPRSVGRGTGEAGSASGGDAGDRGRRARVTRGYRIAIASAAPVIACALGNVDRFDRVRAAHVEQPLARAIGGDGIAHHSRSANLGIARERLARRFGEVAHRLDAI